MKDRSKAYARYWRNSLADAALGRGGFSADELKPYVKVDAAALASGRLAPELVRKLFEAAPPKTPSLDVMFRPWVWKQRLEHGQKRGRGIPEFVTPIRTTARLMPDGRLYPQDDTVIPRDLLEPVERGTFALGTMDDLDTYLTTHRIEAYNDRVEDDEDDEATARFQGAWDSYLAKCRTLLGEVGRGFAPESEGFLVMEHGLLLPVDTVLGASRHILELYDHVREASVDCPLFESLANDIPHPAEPCLKPHHGFAERLAHSNDRFPLADAQRDALSHLLASRNGDILAVNGPPGTGKTTMLLSVVATLWADAALRKGEPPVIVAASTNNQAVTNVIDAFGKDFATGEGPWAGRWIPEVTSFGAYFPSNKKEGESRGKYQTRAFFETVESTEFVHRAEEAYLAAGRRAFAGDPPTTVKDLVGRLHDLLRAEAGKLVEIEASWARLDAAVERVKIVLGDEPDAALTLLKAQGERLEADLKACEERLRAWNAWLADEPIWYGLFAWLPPVAHKRILRAGVFLGREWPEEADVAGATDLDAVGSRLKARTEATRQLVGAHRLEVATAAGCLRAKEQARAVWQGAVALLGANDDELSLAQADALADTAIRFPIFLLTSHYWEGRWLMDMQELGPNILEERKKRGRVALESRWRRRMKLTPCVVSTFFMLPSLMMVSKHVEAKTFAPDYLYDFADLLIVDEAGQVLPEVGGASFLLARKALVIGDTLQIEPIWSMPRQVDVGNMIGTGLVAAGDHETGYRKLTDLGKSAASGSIMRMAQQLTRYHYDPDLARGMFLYEHRRCYDQIIGYCNRLCYQGKLIPRRGSKKVVSEGFQLPAMGYLHIDGVCETGGGGSRRNQLEADTLAAWLARHREELREAYGNRPLAEIVGVVTPFSGQVDAIERACEARGIVAGGKDGLTIGTVHALQGAERPVVLFSTVYSKHADGGFIDRSASMLNVAVSRAKDSFLVFGDMDVFEVAAPGTPRGLLAHYLFSDDANALTFEYLRRPDLKSTAGEIVTLRDAPQHDAFLHELLAGVRQDVHLVTPWLVLERIRDTGALEAMRGAISRGVRIRVYTDPGWVTNHADRSRNEQEWRRLREAQAILGKEGIELLFVRRVHSKSVTGDEDVYCNGSFNWFSARRDGLANHETSFVYRGPALAHDIQALIDSLERRVMRFQSR